MSGYTDLMVDGAPLPHQPDTIIRWLIDRLRSWPSRPEAAILAMLKNKD